MSQACNARGHRSRNISCQADSNGSNGGGDGVDTGLPGQLDTDCPRSASDDPRGSFQAHAKTSRRTPPPLAYEVTPPHPAPSPFSHLWQRTHKKEYVTKVDNSRCWLFFSLGNKLLTRSWRRGGEGERKKEEQKKREKENSFYRSNSRTAEISVRGEFEYGLMGPSRSGCCVSPFSLQTVNAKLPGRLTGALFAIDLFM